MWERIARIRKILNLSQKEFASRISISQAALSQLESGKTSLSIGTVYKLVEVFGINTDWLLFGEGHIFQRHKIVTAKGTPPGHDLASKPLTPLVTKDAEAGYLEKCQDPEFIKTLDGYRIPGFEEGNFRMFQVSGNSMNPSLFDDEIVIAEALEDFDSVQANRMSVIITKEGIVVKRVFPQPNRSLLFKSDNPKFKSYKVTYQNIIEMWEIKAKITSEFLSPPLPAQLSDDIDQRIQALENTVNMLQTALQQKDGQNS